MKQRTKGGQFQYHLEWEEFRSFLRDMGARPTPQHTLDRIDPTNPLYGPGLCRWADKREQTTNRRNTIWLEWEGSRVTVADFATAHGLSYQTVYHQVSKGIALEEIVGHSGESANRYCPARYINDRDGLRQWYVKYTAWKSTLRPAVSHYARPEVFDILKVSMVFQEAQTWMEKQGYFETSPDEEQRRADLLQSPLGKVFHLGIDWMNHAIAALWNVDAEVATKFKPRPGQGYADFHLIEKMLK